MNKENLKIILSSLPNKFELDILIEKLIFIEKVEKGLEQLNAGNTHTHAQVWQKVREWQK